MELLGEVREGEEARGTTKIKKKEKERMGRERKVRAGREGGK